MTVLRLTDPPFIGRTGRGVRVAVLDSGVHADHPHVGGVHGGVSFVGADEGDSIDRIGHGTAVAAAIREKSLDVELLAVKIFDRRLATNVDVLVRAIEWSADHDARIINLSLGTANAAHADRLADAVEYAASRGVMIVSAYESNDVAWYPGSLAGVVAVAADSGCDRDAIRMADRLDQLPIVHASPFPRPIPGVPPERNLAGVSFAVANATGFLARTLENADGWPYSWRNAASGSTRDARRAGR